MAENNTASVPVAKRAGVDQKAWAQNAELLNELKRARERRGRARNTSEQQRLDRVIRRTSEQLYLSNVALSRKVAHRYLRNNSDRDDLYQVAAEALWVAIERWDPDLSPLGVWAFRYIEKACRNHVARTEHGLTPWAWEQRPAVLAAAESLRGQGLSVTADRVSDLTGVTQDMAQLILDKVSAGRDLSLDAPAGSGTGSLSDIVANATGSTQEVDGSAVADAFLDEGNTVTAAALTDDLSGRELFVWLRTNGFDGATAHPTEMLESLLGVSAETVRRTARRADRILAGE